MATIQQSIGVDFQRTASEDYDLASNVITVPITMQDVLLVTVYVRGVDFSTNTAVSLTTNPITELDYYVTDGTPTGTSYIISAATAPDSTIIQGNCMISHWSLPINGQYAFGGNYYDQAYLDSIYALLPTIYSEILVNWDTTTYPTTQFNAHMTVTLASQVKNTTPVDGTPTNTYGLGYILPDVTNSTWGGAPSPLTSGSDLLLFSFMTQTATDNTTHLPPSDTMITPQPLNGGGGTGSYGVAQDSNSAWSLPDVSIAFVTATMDGPGAGDTFRWETTNPNGLIIYPITLATAYLPGATTPVTFTVVPQNAGVRINEQATFTVATTGGLGTVSLQWQVLPASTGVWTNIPGATGTTYTTPILLAADNGNQYRVIASDQD